MTASRPAGALLKEARMVDVADQDYAGRSLLLEMTLQTKGGVTLIQEPLIN
jgi:hypothetical protein